jgi:hypothetical protein
LSRDTNLAIRTIWRSLCFRPLKLKSHRKIFDIILWDFFYLEENPEINFGAKNRQDAKAPFFNDKFPVGDLHAR